MLCKSILLFCIIIGIADGVSRPDRFKTCRTSGGRCIRAADCHKPVVLKDNSCTSGKICCAIGTQKRGIVGREKQLKGCRQSHRCRNSGGRCIPASQPCQGKVKEKTCKKDTCQCCILKDPGTGTKTKFRRVLSQLGKKNRKSNKGNKQLGKERRKSNKRNKKDGGCKKKKKCNGFCIGENEECLGDLDPKGCKGKKCSCCTLGEQKEEKEKDELTTEYFEWDYDGCGDGTSGWDLNYSYDYDHYGSGYYYHYGSGDYDHPGSGDYDHPGSGDHCHSGSGDYYGPSRIKHQCSGKNINGSCDDQGCFICGDDQCYPAHYKCDKYTHCEDGSDEVGCPHEAPGSCPRQYTWAVTSCYKFVAQSSSSWSNSRMVCQALNGDLALVYDNTLFTAYMRAFHEVDEAVYWIGIHRDNGTYTWVNGTVLPDNSPLWGPMENPALGNDGKDCVMMDFSENRLQPTICEVDTYNNKSIYSVCEYADDDYHGAFYDYH